MLGIRMASLSALPAYTKEVTERPDSSRLATYLDFFSALLWPGGPYAPGFFVPNQKKKGYESRANQGQFNDLKELLSQSFIDS